MARKTLADFNYDYQAYADYLESPECTNDDGYDVIADQYGNVYTPTDGDWSKGHGHQNENTDYIDLLIAKILMEESGKIHG